MSSSSEKLYNESLKIDSTKLSEPFRSTFIPSIIKSGFNENDAGAMLEASIRYGFAQLLIDTKINEKDIKIRPIEPSDFTASITAYSPITFDSWNVSINPQEIEYYKITYELKINEYYNMMGEKNTDYGKVFIIFGVEDTTTKQEEYPIKQLSVERSHIKVIDIVDVEDLYHSNYISFLTPVLYRNGDRGNISFKVKNPVQLNLKINGFVFTK